MLLYFEESFSFTIEDFFKFGQDKLDALSIRVAFFTGTRATHHAKHKTESYMFRWF
jgi:hypothetical protein